MPELKLRVTQEEYERFADAAYRAGRMKHQRALKEAVEQWLSALADEDYNKATPATLDGDESPGSINLQPKPSGEPPLTNLYVGDILDASRKLTAQIEALAKLATGGFHEGRQDGGDTQIEPHERRELADIAARHLEGPADPEPAKGALPKRKKRPEK